jgi:subtilisin family serine protease
VVKVRLPNNGQELDTLASLRDLLPGEWLYPNYVYRPFDSIRPSGPVVDASVSRHGACTAERCYGPALIKWQPQLAACARNVKVGVIDTGFDFEHIAFRKLRYHHAVAASQPGKSSNSHGTAVLALLGGDPTSGTPGLIADAEFVIADTFFADTSGETVTDTISLLQALDLMEQFQVRVVNMSFAGPRDPAIQDRIRSMTAKGVMFIAAAGNFGPLAPPVYPAAYEEVVAVTAVDRDRKGYAKANHGNYIDLAAPGVDVWTAFPGNKEGPQSGTSFATPYVTAIAAVSGATLKVPAGGKADPKRALLAHLSTIDLGEKGPDPVYGLGLVQAPQACTPAAQDPIVAAERRRELSWAPHLQQSPASLSVPAAEAAWASTVTQAASRP